jgi:ribonuclease HI
MEQNNQTHLNIFTDGAVPNNQGTNRKGGVGVFFGIGDPRNISFGMKETSERKITNQVCELKACVMGLETVISTEKIANKTITIYTDSMYIVNSMGLWAKSWEKNGWKKSTGALIENEALIKQLYYLTVNLQVKYKYTRAHSVAPSDTHSIQYYEWYGNHMADKLATNAAKNI